MKIHAKMFVQGRVCLKIPIHEGATQLKGDVMN